MSFYTFDIVQSAHGAHILAAIVCSIKLLTTGSHLKISGGAENKLYDHLIYPQSECFDDDGVSCIELDHI